jgi:alginate O-acetyltransferase complex protein AlgI
MAIGLGYMFGFEFRENFNYPYYSRSIGEFWERWHISLSSWFRDYLYYPLGGNRHSTARTYFNLLLVFVLCGLWHGANWTFIVFGLYHGFFMILERLGVAKYLGAGRPIAGHFYAMLVHTCSLVIFTAESLSDAMAYFCVMAGFAEMGDPAHIMEEYLPLDILIAFIVGMIFAQPVRKILSRWRISIHNSLKRSGQVAFGYMFSGLRVAGLYLVLVLCFMSLAAGTHNPFIYFRF